MVVYHEYKTSYTSKSKLLEFLNTPDFFFKIMEGIEEDKYFYKPNIRLEKNLFSKKYVKWPQSISYIGPQIFNFQTNLSFLSEFPFLTGGDTFINSTFTLDYDELYCDISTKFNNLDVNLNFKMKIENDEDFIKLTFICLNSDDLILPNSLIKTFMSSQDYLLKSIFG